jgi:polyisoprenoid-binding protein YceI
MKNTITNMVALSALAFATNAFTTIDTEGEKKEIKVETSTLVWKGYKVTGSHQGTVDIKSGSLIFKDGVLTGGDIMIDMSSIESTDLEGEYKGKLEGHLKSDDFFGVQKYPTASLTLKKVTPAGKNAYTAIGDLTIKGITKPVDLEVSIYGNKATANIKIDRSEFDVRYGSTSFFDGLKDKAIYDEFDLIADFEF